MLRSFCSVVSIGIFADLGTIPDEATFINSGGPVTAGQRQLPPHVTNKVQELDDGSSVVTI